MGSSPISSCGRFVVSSGRTTGRVADGADEGGLIFVCLGGAAAGSAGTTGEDISNGQR